MAETKNDPVDGEQDSKAAAKAHEACYFCWLVSMCKDGIEQAEKYNYEHDKHRDGQCPVKAWPSRITGNDRFLLLFVVALFATVFFSFYALGFFKESNRAVAAFTGVATALGIVQWWTSRRHWQEADEQNRLMIRQMEQTDEMIKHMRADQRPWLCVDNIRWDESDYRKSPLVIVAKNTGKSPAQRTSLDMAITWAAPGTFDSEAHASNPENFERMFDGIVIPPGGARSATLKNLYDYARNHPTPDANELYIILRYHYTDLEGTEYGTDHCCYWDASEMMFPVYGPLAKMY